MIIIPKTSLSFLMAYYNYSSRECRISKSSKYEMDRYLMLNVMNGGITVFSRVYLKKANMA